MPSGWLSCRIICSSCNLTNGHCHFHERPPCLSNLCSMIGSCQTKVKWSDFVFCLFLLPCFLVNKDYHSIQLCRAKFDEVSLICGSNHLVKGPHWIWVLSCGPWMDQHVQCGQRMWDVWYGWCVWSASHFFRYCNNNNSNKYICIAPWGHDFSVTGKGYSFLSNNSIWCRFAVRQFAVLDKLINMHDVFDDRYMTLRSLEMCRLRGSIILPI